MFGFEEVKKEVRKFRNKWGNGIVTDPVLDGHIARYTFMPGDQCGYIQEYDLETGKGRTCGLGTGCFWTDWEE